MKHTFSWIMLAFTNGIAALMLWADTEGMDIPHQKIVNAATVLQRVAVAASPVERHGKTAAGSAPSPTLTRGLRPSACTWSQCG